MRITDVNGVLIEGGISLLAVTVRNEATTGARVLVSGTIGGASFTDTRVTIPSGATRTVFVTVPVQCTAGPVSVTVNARDEGGTVQPAAPVTRTLNVLNAVFGIRNPACPQVGPRLVFSTDLFGLDAAPLNGASVPRSVYVMVTPATGIASVRFSVDGSVVRTDRGEPFSLSEGVFGVPQPRRFSVGARTVTALVTFSDGTTTTLTAAFTAG
jgi:hypothetical protein